MSNSAWSGARPHIDESELLCRMGCGFYGNPAWDGHCSKCYKEVIHKKKMKRTVFDPTEIKNKVSRSVNDVTEFQNRASTMVSKKLDKFEEKRQQLDKRTKAMTSIFKKNTSAKADRSPLNIAKHFSEESEVADAELASYLKSISKEAEQIVAKCLNNFTVRTLKTKESLSVDELADQVHEVYGHIQDLMSTSSAFADSSQEQTDKVLELAEKFITTKFYKSFVAEVNAVSEEKDLAIQRRIRSLNWVSTVHLECKVDETSPEVRATLDSIISDLIEIDSRRVPAEKLRLLVSASHSVLRLLNESNHGVPASADDFLPALIYCVLRANPPLIQSNIAFVTNFARPSSLQSGEAGYFFTNLCCAVSFIEKLTAESLGLTQPEFDRYMAGDALPPNALDPDYMSDSMRRMQKSLDNLAEMESRTHVLLESFDLIVKDWEEFEANCMEKLDRVAKETVFDIRGSGKANIDEPDPTQDLLPPPLMPLQFSSKNEGLKDSRTLGGASQGTLTSEDVLSFSLNQSAECRNNFGSQAPGLNTFLSSTEGFKVSDPSQNAFDRSFGLNLPCDVSPSGQKRYSRTTGLLDEENPSLDNFSIDSFDSGLVSSRGKIVSPNPRSSNTAFSVQGVSIPSIPCVTGVAGYQDPMSMEGTAESLPSPIKPVAVSSLPASEGLGEVLKDFDVL